MDLTIKVMYSCPSCGLRDVEVTVPARTDEDVLVWMDMMGGYLARDHYYRSPSCSADSASNVKIPITGADRVGGAPAH